MPAPDKEPISAKTPGIEEYELQTEASVVTLRIEKFSLKLPRKVEDVLAILEKKAANSLPQERRLFLPKDTTRSLETLNQYVQVITLGRSVEEIHDRDGFLVGYKAISKTPEGHQDIELLRFLPNGIMVQLFAEQERLPWLKNLKGKLSIICSDKVPPEKARAYLEAFAHAPY